MSKILSIVTYIVSIYSIENFILHTILKQVFITKYNEIKSRRLTHYYCRHPLHTTQVLHNFAIIVQNLFKSKQIVTYFGNNNKSQLNDDFLSGFLQESGLKI